MTNIIHKIILWFLVVLMTVAMNTIFRPTSINKPEQTFVNTVEVEVKTHQPISHSNFTNNQKAAFFLAFPIGGMVWITIYALYNNRKKLKTLAKIEREPRVVF